MARHAVASAAASQIAPPDAEGRQWVHLLPLGNVRCRDGRAYRVSNAAAIISQFGDGDVHLPVDYEHATERGEKSRAAVPAAGWITRLKTRADGVWGLIEWTAKAAQMIRDREYRYISPAFYVAPTSSEIVKLKGAGLVHHPAMRLTALASQETDMDDIPADAVPRIARALELPADASLDDMLDAIEALKKGDPSKFVPVDAVAELLRDRNAQSGTMKVNEANAKVRDAMERGFITPAMRPWATALCTRDPDAFDSFLQSATPAYAHLSQEIVTGHPPRHPSSVAASSEAAGIAATLGIDPDSMK